MRLNVKLPEPPNKEQPHLTRFQAHNPPHLMGTTLLGIECEPSETVAQLKAKVAGAFLPRREGTGGEGALGPRQARASGGVARAPRRAACVMCSAARAQRCAAARSRRCCGRAARRRAS